MPLDENALFCECKYTEKQFDEGELKDLVDSSLCINRRHKHYMIFSKNGLTSGDAEKIENDAAFFSMDLKKLYE